MKIRILILVTILGTQHLGAQNLVLNHDFSNLKACLDRRYDSQLAWAPYMGTYNSANDYIDQFYNWFSAPEAGNPQAQASSAQSYVAHHKNCSTAPVDSIALIPIDPRHCQTVHYPSYFPKPMEGQGYAGLRLLDSIKTQTVPYPQYVPSSRPCGPISTFTILAGPVAIREEYKRNFIETKLAQALLPGEDYTLEFSVVRRAASLYTTGDIGAYVSLDTFRYEDWQTQNIQPQVQTLDSIYNSKKDYWNWTRVKGSFIASGGEEFLTIGNFKDYNLNDYKKVYIKPTPLDTSWNAAYYILRTPADYFFDAVYLYKSTDSIFAVSLPADTTLCPEDSLRLYANHTNTFKIQANKTFRWSTGATDSSITIGSPGIYWVEVAYNNRWKQYDTIVVDYHPTYQSGLSRDTTICKGEFITVQVPAASGVSHQWSNGSGGSTATLSSEGAHWLKSFTACDTLVDTLTISYYPEEDLGLPTDTVLCRGKFVELVANQILDADYSWNNGSTTNSSTYYEEGTATLTVITQCDTLTVTTQIEQNDCEEPEVYIPNSFTPNGDGLNEYFEIVNLPADNSLKVFNRWGEMIYEATPYRNDWDGTMSNGSKALDGVYIFQLRYQWRNKQVLKHDWVHIIRP